MPFNTLKTSPSLFQSIGNWLWSGRQYAKNLLQTKQNQAHTEYEQAAQQLSSTELKIAEGVTGVITGTTAAVVIYLGASYVTVGLITLKLLPKPVLDKLVKTVFGEKFQYVLDIQHLADYTFSFFNFINGILPSGLIQFGAKKVADNIISMTGSTQLKQFYEEYNVSARILVWSSPVIALYNAEHLLHNVTTQTRITTYQNAQTTGTITDNVTCESNALFEEQFCHWERLIEEYNSVENSLTTGKMTSSDGESWQLISLQVVLPDKSHLTTYNEEGQIVGEITTAYLPASTMSKFEAPLPESTAILSLSAAVLSVPVFVNLLVLVKNLPHSSTRTSLMIMLISQFSWVNAGFTKNNDLEYIQQGINTLFPGVNNKMMPGFTLEKEKELTAVIKRKDSLTTNKALGKANENAVLASVKFRLLEILVAKYEEELKEWEKPEDKSSIAHRFLITLELIAYIYPDEYYNDEIIRWIKTISKMNDAAGEKYPIKESEVSKVAEQINTLSSTMHSRLVQSLIEFDNAFNALLLDKVFKQATKQSLYALEYLKSSFSFFIKDYFKKGNYEILFDIIYGFYQEDPEKLNEICTAEVAVAIVSMHDILKKNSVEHNTPMEWFSNDNIIITKLLDLHTRFSTAEIAKAGKKLGLEVKNIREEKTESSSEKNKKSYQLANKARFGTLIAITCVAGVWFYFKKNKTSKKPEEKKQSKQGKLQIGEAMSSPKKPNVPSKNPPEKKQVGVDEAKTILEEIVRSIDHAQEEENVRETELRITQAESLLFQLRNFEKETLEEACFAFEQKIGQLSRVNDSKLPKEFTENVSREAIRKMAMVVYLNKLSVLEWDLKKSKIDLKIASSIFELEELREEINKIGRSANEIVILLINKLIPMLEHTAIHKNLINETKRLLKDNTTHGKKSYIQDKKPTHGRKENKQEIQQSLTIHPPIIVEYQPEIAEVTPVYEIKIQKIIGKLRHYLSKFEKSVRIQDINERVDNLQLADVDSTIIARINHGIIRKNIIIAIIGLDEIVDKLDQDEKIKCGFRMNLSQLSVLRNGLVHSLSFKQNGEDNFDFALIHWGCRLADQNNEDLSGSDSEAIRKIYSKLINSEEELKKENTQTYLKNSLNELLKYLELLNKSLYGFSEIYEITTEEIATAIQAELSCVGEICRHAGERKGNRDIIVFRHHTYHAQTHTPQQLTDALRNAEKLLKRVLKEDISPVPSKPNQDLDFN